MVRLTMRDPWWRFASVLERGEDFVTSGALDGRRGGCAESVRLPDEFRVSAASAVYVVLSYGTPIAWRNCDGSWTVPDVRYSVTTSRHQSKIAAAVGQLV